MVCVKPSSRNKALPLWTTLPLRMLGEVTWLKVTQLEWQSQGSEARFIWHQNACFLLHLTGALIMWMQERFHPTLREQIRIYPFLFCFSFLSPSNFSPLSSSPFSFSPVVFSFLVFPPYFPISCSCLESARLTLRKGNEGTRILSLDLINLSPTYLA